MADSESEQDRGLQQSKLSPNTRTSGQPTHLDLFSGIGGFALAAQWAGFRTIGFCEIDKYCQKVLSKNFLPHSKGNLRGASGNEVSHASDGAGATIHRNIFDLDGTQFRGVTLITGGFPCQPFSVAGKRRGAADDRAIWPEMFRVINEARPDWVLGENVPGIIPMELDNMLSDLESIGYSCRPFVIPACAVDAKHRRDRLWIVGRNIRDTEYARLDAAEVTRSTGARGNGGTTWAQQTGEPTGSSEQQGELERPREASGTECCEWLPEPDVGRVAHGVRNRVDRLKGLGNAIVPQVAYEILKEIRKLI